MTDGTWTASTWPGVPGTWAGSLADGTRAAGSHTPHTRSHARTHARHTRALARSHSQARMHTHARTHTHTSLREQATQAGLSLRKWL
jgi:hypothetical protein